MDLYQKCLILTAGFSIVIADFRYEHFKTFSFHGNDNPSQNPWFLDDYSDYKPEASRTVHHYTYPYDDNVKHGSIHIPTYEEYSPYSDSYFSSTKKIPKEDKAFKKSISPFYTITDKDSTKYKELVLKSGLPYCQEIKSKKLDDKIKDEPNSNDSKSIEKDAMTCYKCKDPKNKSTYEQCSYSSEPQASTNIERFEHGPLRLRRSNEEFDSDEEESVPDVSLTATKDGKLKEPYRFSEEYFLPQASRKLSSEQKPDLCERVVKDSMVCMVCKDPKTSGKYEQCSYVAEPNEKAYAYTKSRSFGKPTKSEKSANLKKRDHKEPAPTHESLESSEYGDDEVSEERPRQVKDATGDSECKQVQRDSEICIVCKDPKTGGNSERCSYAYNPDDKVYKFTKSKSFGYPESEKSDKSSSYEDDESDKEVSESDPKESTRYSDDEPYDYSDYQKPKKGSSYESQESPSSYGSDESKESQTYDYDPPSADYIKSESEKILKDAESDNCKKVEKDSMICTVCKDPKTGGNSESCSYSYQPDDKKFAYTKSKSFGSPTENRGGNKESEESNPYGSSEYTDDGGYYATEHKPVAYQNGRQETDDSKTQGVVSNQGTTQAPVSKVDLEFLGTSKRQEEIEKFLKEFQAEDRSKCQKVMRDKMTCYQCQDETGVQKEECMFITAPENKTKNRVADQESKEFKLDPKPEAAISSTILKKKKKIAKVKKNSSIPLEPTTLASQDSLDNKSKNRVSYRQPKEFKIHQKPEAVASSKISRKKKRITKVKENSSTALEPIASASDGSLDKKSKNRIAYRESKEFKLHQKPEAAASSTILKKKKKVMKVRENSPIPLEPTASASEDSYTRKNESKKKNSGKDEDDDLDENDDQDGESYDENNDYRDRNDHEDQKYNKDGPEEAEPYEYVAATKYKYDKVLGLTLPAHMLETSEFEKEFDDIYNGGRSSS